MIEVGIPAISSCDHEGQDGCDATAPVQLVLIGLGVFAFVTKVEGWQILSTATNPGAPFRSFCPKHHIELPRIHAPPPVQVGPAGLRKRAH